MSEVIDCELWKPVRVKFSNIEDLRSSHPEIKVVDEYKKNLEGVFLLRNPKFRNNNDYGADFERFYLSHLGSNDPGCKGVWFYYTWLNQLVHFLDEEFHQELRTGRNCNLITREEQERYYNATVAVLGLSIGSHVAATLTMTGGTRNIRVADPDVISGDNLNRIRAGFQDVGTNKAVFVARQITEVNPYVNIKVFPDGLNESNMASILDGLDVLVEEVDDIYWKLKIREMARERGIPVVMGTDNGDGIIVDIERFDYDAGRRIFHGKIGNLKAKDVKNLLPENLPQVAATIAGPDIAVPRMLESVTEVGKTIYSWPQLGTAANLCGTVVAYLVRRIVLEKKSVRSGRYQVSLNSIFDPGYRRGYFSRKIRYLRFLSKMMWKK